MGLAQVQRLLAHLYTDPALRERFVADHRASGEAFGLTDQEIEQLARISISQVTTFARSLRRKRLRAVSKLLPLTSRALGDCLVDLFERYANTSIGIGTCRYHEDTIRFAAYVTQTARHGHLAPPWVFDLLRYEAGRLRATDPARRFTHCWLREPISTLVRRPAPEAEVSPPRSRPTIALWFRLSSGDRLRHCALSLPWACPWPRVRDPMITER